MISSGLREGTSALATRGVQVEEFEALRRIIAAALGPDFDERKAEYTAAPRRSPSATRSIPTSTTRCSPRPWMA